MAGWKLTPNVITPTGREWGKPRVLLDEKNWCLTEEEWEELSSLANSAALNGSRSCPLTRKLDVETSASFSADDRTSTFPKLNLLKSEFEHIRASDPDVRRANTSRS